ncbi:SulP family inorganic anion transporter [Pseudofulvimonas gallinarii]|jgi:SulP family sulfate permease|uniref:SulP family sulfate permease n=1 Tax=Pseudofulvimonas gallinarii TaxID=634155 RepID=A0A4R3LA86_9GAMM|nr:SulP family inorganic anion transporter [Pseudofulvimonas gallinarii]TCS96035.1 SulP family sulfate permease [Pseudofulvimonas gallinarii]THD13294.1 sodium-independent anion transporter [Pseudofulvimonas gallinarii]
MYSRNATPSWHLYLPKLVTVLRHGYSVQDLRRDLLAGLTVAVVALPLAMALAIASGTTPEKGLHTAIIAGFLISAFGGSRVQIGGPTAAFIPVVFNVIERFGYGGLLLCTLIAGLVLIAAGLMRVGALMRYMPQPVITGFTAGIAVTIFLSQVKDALGLEIERLPGEFFERLQTYGQHLGTFNPWSIALTVGCLALIIGLRRWRPAWPGFLIAVIAGSLFALGLTLPVATIGSAYGDIPSTLPAFALPELPFSRIGELLPSALTIAFLAGVESLLSAVVADGMIGGRHRSNCELVAQGIANVGSALFGGLPATGAIARTATNVRAGARSPVAGMMHAVFLLVFMLVLAPLMRWVPLPALAAVLLVVAWNMSEIERFRHLMKAPVGDRVVLLATFGLTVMFDLTVAIQVGVLLAAFQFMHRMSEVVALDRDVSLVDEDQDDLAGDRQPDMRDVLPGGVAAFRISGPLFFAVANRLDNVLDQFADPPRAFILRLRLVPLIDASGAQALESFLDRCHRLKIRVLLSGIQPQPSRVLRDMGISAHPAVAGMARDFEAALILARQLVA